MDKPGGLPDESLHGSLDKLLKEICMSPIPNPSVCLDSLTPHLEKQTNASSPAQKIEIIVTGEASFSDHLASEATNMVCRAQKSTLISLLCVCLSPKYMPLTVSFKFFLFSSISSSCKSISYCGCRCQIGFLMKMIHATSKLETMIKS